MLSTAGDGSLGEKAKQAVAETYCRDAKQYHRGNLSNIAKVVHRKSSKPEDASANNIMCEYRIVFVGGKRVVIIRGFQL